MARLQLFSVSLGHGSSRGVSDENRILVIGFTLERYANGARTIVFSSAHHLT